jgi:hypothetical protein
MLIRMRSDGTLVTYGEFRAMFPNTSFPPQLTEGIINDFGGDVVFEGPQATGGTVYQYSVYSGVEQAADGKWYTKYSLGPTFFDTTDENGVVTTAAQHEAEYKARKDAEHAKSVREQRSQKLKESDWTQLSDAPVDKAVWATYRQALRDITTQAGFPWNVTWPDAPGA